MALPLGNSSWISTWNSSARSSRFREPSLDGFAHFENAGGSYACGQTIAWLNRYYRQTKVQPYYAFAPSAEAGGQMDAARERLAAWLNVGRDELHFGPSTSQNTFVLAQALRRHLRPGDEIIVTNQDHEANSVPAAGSRTTASSCANGKSTRRLPTSPQGSRGAARSAHETRRVHALLNVVGSINPVREFADLAHRAGAWVFVDGVAFSPHGLPDVGARRRCLLLLPL